MSSAQQTVKISPETPMAAYQAGDKDVRPWGHYIVTAAGKDATGREYCEKTIVIKPGQILSLQSHRLRQELWTVKKGTLTALLDGKRLEILSRESLFVPPESIHCMANLDEEDCTVEERQEGICREDDIRRYMDAYQRPTESLSLPKAAQSIAAYRAILSDIERISANRRQGVPY